MLWKRDPGRAKVPSWTVHERVRLGPDSCAFLRSFRTERDAGAPVLLVSSGHVALSNAAGSELTYLFQGPEGTPGVARFYQGNGSLRVVDAIRPDGSPAEVHLVDEGETALLRYPCEPFGIAVRLAAE